MLEGPLVGLLYALFAIIGLLILCGIGGGIAFSIIELIKLRRRRRHNDYININQSII